MSDRFARASSVLVALIIVGGLPAIAHAHLLLGSERSVESGGAAIDVSGYSVPSAVDWNSDGLIDLIVGEGTGTGKIRIYLNQGTQGEPQFSGFSYAQSLGSDLEVSGGG